jgi:putative endopeptidase
MYARTSPLVLSVIATLLLAACGSKSSPPRGQSPAGPHGVYVADLNRAVDPCTDFFEFSNGTWRAENPIPASMVRWSRRWEAGETAKERLKEILDETSARRDWPKASVEQLIGDFYGGCMDEAAIEARGLEPLRPLLAQIDAIQSVAGVGEMIGRLHVASVPVAFSTSAGSDLHAPTNVITWVAASGLGLPDRDYYVKTEPRFTEARAKYLEHIAAILRLAGDSDLSARRAAERVMALELSLAKATLDNVARRDPKAIDHKMTAVELQLLTPSFDWAAYLKAGSITPVSMNITEPAFLVELENQLRATPLADWKTYLRWSLLSAAAPTLSQPFVAANFAFYEAYLGGAQELKPRWKRCVEDTDALLGEALGKKYTDRYFPPQAKARMQLLVKNLLAAMHDTLTQIDWMSAATKEKAFQKLATFNPKIGYPDKWKDYSSIPVSRDRYWESAWAARQWNVADDRQTIGKPVDRDRWGLTPPTSNAYYNPLLNEIVFPAGILQPPAFSLEAVDAINYGAIGVVIGHEISHGFDDQGSQFDAEGKLRNWWTEEDLQKFRARGQCIADQYEAYFVEPGLHHNGKLVLGEAIGDSGGANLAYRAYQKAKAQTPAPTVDGFTPDQQFFIAWGQFRGDAIRPETQRLMVQGDPHPIGKYRVIGPLSHMPEFQAAFSCKADAPMVKPADQRCVVW